MHAADVDILSDRRLRISNDLIQASAPQGMCTAHSYFQEAAISPLVRV